ncbi:RecX family transcriptional regulator [bacterium]|nr:RecX family transcriptional regulator [bacterium]
MKINLKEKFNSKALLEVYIDERVWGVLPKKLLKPFLTLKEIDNEEFKELRQLLFYYSRDRLFTYLAKQEHSEHESRKYLQKLKVHKSIREDVIEFCLDKSFISDARLTELYVRSMIELGKSKTEIIFKMKTKGVSPDLIDKELELQYDKQAKLTIIHENITKAIKIYSNRGSKDVYNKCCSYMMRKGFFYAEFSDILKEKLNYDEDDY